MNKTSFLLVGATLLTGVAARADISWQHSGKVTVNGQKAVTFDFANSWSGANHHAQFQYDATWMADKSAISGGPMMTDEMARNQISFIERLDDDRLVVAIPGIKTYIEEPYSTLKARLRFNIWEGLDPSLNKGEVPELTDMQRERLGHEVRAALSPFTKRLTRIYFRELPNRRTIKGLNCRGYRYTTLVNTSGVKGGQWTRMAAEWWLADVLPGDQELIDFTQRANKLKAAGPLTQSMWANEYLPVIWQVAPPELHRALESMIGAQGSANYGFQGTPAQLFVTVELPPTRYMRSKSENIRFALELKSRDQSAVKPALFETPTDLKRQPIEPFLQMVKTSMTKLRKEVEKGLDDEFGKPQPAGPAVPKRALELMN